MNNLLDVWDQRTLPASLPARSQFYSLERLGSGTGIIESLTSYITRAARAHFLPPWVVATKDLAPRFRCAKISQNGHCDLFGPLAAALNGNCTTAREGAEITGQLTLREGLGDLT